MLNDDEKRGLAIAFSMTEGEVLEDLDRYRRGLAWEDIPPDHTTRHAIRQAIRRLGPSLIQEGIDAAHLADRDQLDATGWVGRHGAYIVRGGLYASRDPRKLRRPARA